MNEHPLSSNCSVIVDPYSSGAKLAEALRIRRAKCVAIESAVSLPVSMRSGFNPNGFSEVISHQTDFEQTLAAVKRHQPTHVVAGFESGVELAERLAAALKLPVNGPQRGAARRNKFLMTSTLR